MNHLDAAMHARGASQYVDDVPRQVGTLHAAIHGSSVAHGHILSMDVAPAFAIEGVVAVLTAADIPGENQIGPIILDEPLLADGDVHFEGQPVAVVVATTQAAGRKGAAAIVVEVDELPAIIDPRAAYEAGEIIGVPRTFEIGDVNEAWASCNVIVEGECVIGGQEHVYLETQRARAVPLEEGRMRIYSSTQSPYAVQRMTAKILGISHHGVEVEVKRLGGGFGGKEDQATPWACIAALAAHKTRQPVEIVLRRDEDLRMTGKRHPYVSNYKLGLGENGHIVAFEAVHLQNAGAAADLSTAVLERTLFHSTNSYYVPHARITGVSCRTNLTPHTAFRGFGGPQGMFVFESALAHAAETLGVPREVLQRKNLLSDGDLFPYGQAVENGRAVRTWEQAAQDFDLNGMITDANAFNDVHDEVKKGVAVMPICFGISFTSTFMNQAGALVHIYTDGSVSVSSGGVEMGQGLSTNIALVAARVFGIDASLIKVESTDTTRVANMSPSAASSTTLLNGNAVLVAAGRILDRLKHVAANEFRVIDVARISVHNEVVCIDAKPTEWTWQRLVRQAYLQRIDLSAHGFYATPRINYDRTEEKGHPFAYHVYGTAITEVTLDCLRGRYEIDCVKIVHDLGRTLNPNVDLGQIEGGLAQGLGWMTLEDLQWDEKGHLLSNALASYKVPDVYFMPDDLQVHCLEDADETTGPFGNKAVGEPPLMYGIGLFFALRNAIRAFNPQANPSFQSPMTPERVLLGLYPEFGRIQKQMVPFHGVTRDPESNPVSGEFR